MLRTIWGYLDKHPNIEAAVLVRFVLLTGCRPGEAYNMQWADLDKSTASWTKRGARPSNASAAWYS